MPGPFQDNAFQPNAYQTTLGAVVAAISEWLIRFRRIGRR